MIKIAEGNNQKIKWRFCKTADGQLLNAQIEIIPDHRGKIVIDSSQTKTIKADGLLTKNHSPMIMKTADCIPAIVYWPENDFVGLLHLGFKGLFRRLPNNFLAQTKLLKLNIAQAQMVFGPSICVKCYTHQNAIRKIKWGLLKTKYPQLAASNHGRFNFDLTGAFQKEFQKIGVKKNHINIIKNCCTHCQLDVSRHHGQQTAAVITIVEKR